MEYELWDAVRVSADMKGYYAVSIALFLAGLALVYYSGTQKPSTDFTTVAFFAGDCLTFMGAAAFFIVFGYLVRNHLEKGG